jgi:hypothetical protein
MLGEADDDDDDDDDDAVPRLVDALRLLFRFCWGSCGMTHSAVGIWVAMGVSLLCDNNNDTIYYTKKCIA